MSDGRKIGADQKKQIPPRCARQDDNERLEGGRMRRSEKTTESSAELRSLASPASLLPAELATVFSRNLLDTHCRTASHPSDSKQTIGVMLTRHTKEVSPPQLFHPNPAPGRLRWFYGQDEERCRSLGRYEGSAFLGRQRPRSRRDAGATKTGSHRASVLTLAGEFPIIARRLLHRPIPYQAKEPRV